MSIEKLRPSFTFTEDRLKELQAVVPEAFADGKINWDTLREALGENLEDPAQEHFGLTWPGKREARRLAAMPSKGTLVPQPGEGVNEDNTHNIFIEGDNLEVLKLLLKSYAGRVKMIYIDPPYNTGNDFIYPDDYSEPLESYLKRTGQVDEVGQFLTTNTRASGRYHANWLSMMYPRLLLARQLLSDDGVIFVSIDDNEADNLRSILNEIFGEENYLVTLYIQVRYADKTLSEKMDFQKLIEQILVFQKSSAFVPVKENEEYTLEKFEWKINELSRGKRINIGGRDVEIFKPGEYEIIRVEPSIDNLKETWATGSVLRVNASGKFFGDYLEKRKSIDGLGVLYKVYGIGEDGLGYRYFTGPKKEESTKGKFYSGVPIQRRKELALGSSLKSKPINNYYNLADAFGNCRHEGEIEFRNGKKPLALLNIMLNIATDKDDIVLDFFAGSATTAHAVLQKNREDHGRRRFIMVQLPEPTDIKSMPNIAELGRERLRRSIRQMMKGSDGQVNLDPGEDLGFLAFKLDHSHFSDLKLYIDKDVTQLELKFQQAENPLIKGWKPENLHAEILLLQGFPLDSQVIPLDSIQSNHVQRVHSDACGHDLFICLDAAIDPDTIPQLHLRDQDVFICLDAALTDQLKVQLADTCNLKVI